MFGGLKQMNTAIKAAPEQDAMFVDLSGKSLNGPDYWAPVKVPRAAIEAQIEQLARKPLPANGRRCVSFVHPSAVAPGLGFAPGIDVMINVLKPGEATEPLRHNSNMVNICVRGEGSVRVKDGEIHLQKWDVCNIPSMQTYAHANTGTDLWAWLSYSNAPLLEKLGNHYFELNPPTINRTAADGSSASRQYVRQNAPDLPVGGSGARFRGYEYLTDIEVVENHAHHWPWSFMEQNVSTQLGDNKRTIMLLYNPATERRNGTTHSFFVTCASTPAGSPPRKVGRGHRHSSVAINYHFRGAGMSIVNGHRIDWEAGDLLLSAPGWSEHAHYMSDQGSTVYTVQDHPLQIGMESLIWQESMDGPILALGSEAGQTGYVAPRNKGE
jgi:gentisate 1,2-dioxygenase